MASVTIDFDNLAYQRVEAPRWAFIEMRDDIRAGIRRANAENGVDGTAEWLMVLRIIELRKTGWTHDILTALIYWAVWGQKDKDAIRDIGVHDLEIVYRTRPDPDAPPHLDPDECRIISVTTRRVWKH